MERLCSALETLIYGIIAIEIQKTGQQVGPNPLPHFSPSPLGTQSETVRALHFRRKKVIETYIQTLTEIWVDGGLSGFLVTDTYETAELNEEFVSTHSMRAPRTRMATRIVRQSQREIWL